MLLLTVILVLLYSNICRNSGYSGCIESYPQTGHGSEGIVWYLLTYCMLFLMLHFYVEWLHLPYGFIFRVFWRYYSVLCGYVSSIPTRWGCQGAMPPDPKLKKWVCKCTPIQKNKINKIRKFHLEVEVEPSTTWAFTPGHIWLFLGWGSTPGGFLWSPEP